MNTNHNTVKPPRLAKWLLKSFCSYDYLSTALWDLEELFYHDLETKGVTKARLLYLQESLSIIFHLYFKGKSQYAMNSIAMFKNNLIIALRNFRRHKNHTTLNVLGLSSGLMIFLLITLFTTYEFSYDTHHENADRIYRIYKRVNTLEELYLDSGTPGPLAESMLSEFPEVEAAARFIKYRKQLISANNRSFVEPAIHVADPSVFNIFSFEAVSGHLDDFLKNGQHIAISESCAMKYFGRTDVANETMLFEGETPLIISGVYKDMPANSHFTMDIIANFEWVMKAYDQDLSNWNNNPFYTYVLLKEDADPVALEAKLTILREKYANDPIADGGQSSTYFLQPLTDVHFTQNINGSMGETADASRLYVFTTIALIVLIMAGINYVNLATARAIVRVKETGVRKIMGAKRNGLLSQFLLESGLLVFLSLLLALFFAYLVLPLFSFFVDRPLSFAFGDHMFWLQIIGLGLVITLLSGIYPAIVMSSFNPLDAISKRSSFTSKGHLRNGLVVFQFALSAILILAALVLQRQLSFIDTVDTGYNRERVVVLSMRDDAIRKKQSTYMQELRQVAGVEVVAKSWSLPTNVTSNAEANWPGIEDGQRIPMYLLGVTHDFFDLYQIELVEGRSFDRKTEADQSAIMLNEAAVKAFGWENPIGREMITQTGEKATVIGVVKDFHLKSLREEIKPLQIILNPQYGTLAVRVKGDMATTIAGIKEVYKSFEPSYPFEYRYFEDIYDRAYADDNKTAQLTLVFTSLAILIACLGLYGLASHKVAHRVKELGVRKVMGASSLNIARLLFRDFLLLIGIAFVFAGPIAYFLMNSWLDGFAYHIEFGASLFGITLLILLGFAGVTVGYRTFKASVISPVTALRDE
ncbi:MAG: ABC transporter permease [Bacteroidota bacterium]